MNCWWKSSVFYEIYVRSFQDSNGDGIGDLRGIASRLDYLQDLGIDALWLTPFYPSPQVDFGYDISNYVDVDPLFGTLDDFDRLVADAHRRGIRIVIDLVLNHTSDRHPFFVESRRSRSSPYRDWYVWRDGRGDRVPPNNWQSSFGGPAWSFDEATGQWYYHFFYAQQPDLNWRNPAVERWIHDVVRFWIARGVDGFRLDAINTLFEDPELRDNPPLATPRVKLTGVYTQEFVYNRGRPEVHDVLRRLRAAVERDAPGTLLISEAYVDTIDDLVAFYGDDDEVQLPFNFFLAQVPRRDPAAFRRAIAAIETAVGRRWPSLVLNNHDIARACDRLADGADPDAVAKALAVILLTARGTPFLYYGEEIGMRTEPVASLDEVRDPVGRRFWPAYKGRDGVRRPMPWTGDPGGGFTSATPWLPLPSDAGARNVARQGTDPSSILELYRRLIALRRDRAALRDGAWRPVGGSGALAYLRQSADDAVLVAVNLNDAAVDVDGLEEFDGRWHVELGTARRPGEPVAPGSLRLEAMEAVILSRESEVASRSREPRVEVVRRES